MDLPQSLKDISVIFSRLPGVGQKTAMRYSMALMSWSEHDREKFSEVIEKLGDIHHCGECGAYSDKNLCDICDSDARKDSKMICVVENINDLMAIERGGFYKGTFHVLGGVLNPLRGIGPDQLKIEMLEKRIVRDSIQEVVLAINPSIEGDATCAYLANILQGKCRIERIGFGIPIGGNLEFLDPLTISKAIENRQIL